MSVFMSVTHVTFTSCTENNSLSEDDDCTPLLNVLGPDAMSDVIGSVTTGKDTKRVFSLVDLLYVEPCHHGREAGASPEDGDTASPHWQDKHRLRHTDGLELEAAAEAQGAVTEEGHRDDGSSKYVQRIHV